ncbi:MULTISPECIES: DUF1641 domain-containing protein [Aneurinibacillus]|uniref:DUF1641 domain-containing protein n=1 Tax=Aneurinibacillus thermoaerophilus TaxID=143495 RepID=A0A1G8DIU5_ANETH|nr:MULTISPECIES: DUF1641 domain-containing protein [Aneurinibacillus]AMA74361.1 hypothetical protein ACH33_17115 [Aneurinibacillus sp. XH2]MED0674205.1 DUF1641 domain-containing protein [Aneurinibacillus thermoaerophilus]MED0678769.1 DUF1641 domain-containing protein [Aneurinibacillus thermoaerophilus]MED0736758.1 DUF1641 domain-containing protein [Aneurinibacillus thermoaerophilus]MED0758270.1 DUF1641 domain-containing protein [Aneurinibacillus thermoaerophilus]
MAKPTTTIKKHEPTEAELQAQALEELTGLIAKNGEALQELLKVIRLLYESGALEIIGGLIQAREKVVEIGISQLSKPTMTRGINSVMSVVGMLGEMEPETIKKVVEGIVNGMRCSVEKARADEKMSLFDLIKAYKDPDVNRAITIMLSFLKGMGQKL